ncbi:MAG TPA: hypothetical protein VJL87_03380, partial [Bdellovibrionota bacterium]|nr:hypothetical protein [Bdellovibrionota bacterium]
EAIKILQQGYEKVISLGDPEWTMASYFHLGLANERTAATILNAPWPKDLTTTQREEFFITLQNRGLPYEDRAIIMYQKVLSFERASPKSGKEWLSLAKAHLKKLMQ